MGNLHNRKIFFRADAGAKIGYGHFIRTLALADMLKDDFDCTFFTTAPTEYQANELNKVCKYIPLEEEYKFDKFLEYLSGDEIVVLDNYFYSTDYQKQIKDIGCKLVCIDDIHDKHYVADIVINHALTDTSLFSIEPYTKLCLGFEYALLRAPFLKPINETCRNNDLIISFGAADPFGITDKVVSMLLTLNIQYQIVVILGDKVYLSEANRQQVSTRKNLSAEQMAELFEQSAAGILSASTVCIEALSRNLPLAVGYHVDNQIEFYGCLAKSMTVQPLGNLQKIDTGVLLRAIKNIASTSNLTFPIGIKERYKGVFLSLVK
ncbi:MAG: UDP-2,4-diacetamido-2,4,6-trideoxy-beta-L-altropyranose hydrolase [Bacteroidales bacterium]|nr:UDP-2,4-diacetamido-2,4,6-trideoxy-beta-L-altropyranose hydrolase [Bacteroidales bacterium]